MTLDGNHAAGVAKGPKMAAARGRRALAGLPAALSEEPASGVKPAAAESLADDGRIGKISDSQGLVVLKPALAQRWTPVTPETLLLPQDWVRTDMRGANAARLRLTSGVELTIGPGTLIELISPTQARLHTGEVRLKLSDDLDSAQKDADRNEAQQPANAGGRRVPCVP